MADIAELGFKVDSSGLKEANQQLELFPELASKADAAAGKLTGTIKNLSDEEERLAERRRRGTQYDNAGATKYIATLHNVIGAQKELNNVMGGGGPGGGGGGGGGGGDGPTRRMTQYDDALTAVYRKTQDNIDATSGWWTQFDKLNAIGKQGLETSRARAEAMAKEAAETRAAAAANALWAKTAQDMKNTNMADAAQAIGKYAEGLVKAGHAAQELKKVQMGEAAQSIGKWAQEVARAGDLAITRQNLLANSNKHVQTTAMGVGGAIRGMLALYAVNKIVDFAVAQVKMGAEIASTAAQLDMTTDRLQTYRAMALTAGVSQEAATAAVSKFKNVLGQATLGSKQQIDAFKQLGVMTLDAKGKTIDEAEALSLVAGKLLLMEDGAKRAALEQEFFGKSGKAVSGILQQLAGGVDESTEKFRRMGLILDEQAVANLDKVNTQMEIVKRQFEVLSAKIVAPIAAVFLQSTISALDTTIKLYEEATKKHTDWARVMELLDIKPMGQTPQQNAANQRAIEAAAELVKKKELAAALEDIQRISGDISRGDGTAKMREQLQKAIEKAEQLEIALGRVKKAADAAATVADTLDRKQAQIDVETNRLINEGLPAKDGPKPTGTQYPTARGGGSKTVDEYTKMARAVEEYTKKKQAEAEAIGKTTIEAAALKHEQDMLNKFIEKGTVATATQAAQIKLWAAEMAAADQVLAKAQFMKAATDEAQKYINTQLIVQQTLGMTAASAEAYRFVQEKINEAIRVGNPLTEAEIALLKQKASAMEEVGNQTNKMKEQFEFAKSTTKDFIKELVGGLREGKDMMKVLGDAAMNVLNKIADKMIDMAVDELFADIFDAKGKGGGGSSVKEQFNKASGSGGFDLSKGFDKLGNMFSESWGKTTDFFQNSTIFGGQGVGAIQSGPYAGLQPSSMVGVPVAEGANVTGSGAAAGIGGSGISAMGAAGAGLGVITGAMTLANSKGTGDTIKGIGTMVGAVVSLIPGIGQIAGPIIMIASQILGSLIGNAAPEPVTDQAYGQLSFGSGGFFTTGGAWGPNAKAEALQGPLGAVGGNIQAIFDVLGGVQDPSKVWGMALESISKGGVPGWDFKSSSSFLVDPSGNKQLWRMNEDDMLGTGGAQVAIRSVLGGAVGTLTDTMRRGLESIQNDTELTFEKIGVAISELLSYELAISQFGKTVTAAESAMNEVNASMQEYYEMANKYNLDTAVLDAEKNRLRLERAMTDFAQPIIDRLRAIEDPMGAEIADLDKWRTEAINNNAYLVATVVGYANQINNIEKVYGLERTEIIERYAEEARRIEEEKQAAILALQKEAADFALALTDELLGLKDPQALELLQLDRWLAEVKLKNQEYIDTVTGYHDQLLVIEELYGLKRQAILEKYLKPLDDLLKRLIPGGDLANVDQTATLAGLQATYSASRAAAMASPNDQQKMSDFINAAGALADFALKYYGGSGDYNLTRDQIIADTEALRAAGGGGMNAGNGAANDDVAAATGPMLQLVKTVQDLTDQLKISLEQNAQLQGQVVRLLANAGGS